MSAFVSVWEGLLRTAGWGISVGFPDLLSLLLRQNGGLAGEGAVWPGGCGRALSR